MPLLTKHCLSKASQGKSKTKWEKRQKGPANENLDVLTTFDTNHKDHVTSRSGFLQVPTQKI